MRSRLHRHGQSSRIHSSHLAPRDVASSRGARRLLFVLFGISAILFIAAVAPAAPAAEPIVLENCLLALIDEADVPAQQAGLLMDIPVEKGQPVSAHELLAQIDDRLAKRQVEVAESKLTVAEKEAANKIHIDYATASTEVARQEHQMAVDANERARGTVPLAEVHRLMLKWKESYFSIKQAEMNYEIANEQLKVSQAELNASKENLEHYKITSLYDGEVVDVIRKRGEWVQIGTPVLRVVRMNKLRAQGYLSAEDVKPSAIDKAQPVVVDVQITREETVRVTGRIYHVGEVVQAGAQFPIEVDVDNRRQADGYWFLRPGLPVTLTIPVR
ncbi:MAG TPA: HlyD family efflux transporter periplasmic adaptor subunit [Thermoguttaceae bacterium]|nr:HlyD family efflux transporter periplasmic adaptor subunit [Thermoguttaceae bacterium]